jgi:hypothetical protein
MQARTEKMKVNSSELGDTSDALRAHFSCFDAIISETERVKKQLEADHAERKEYVPA